jgi:hypothetical protein
MKAVENILDKLKKLQNLYHYEGNNDILNLTLDKLIEYEIKNSQENLGELKEELEIYESKYRLSSEDFYRRFQKGEFGDKLDLVEWSIFYKMWLYAQERLQILEGDSR